MTRAPASEQPSSTALVEALVALRAVMSDERRAIARLDLAALEELTARKQAAATELAGLLAAGMVPTADEAHVIVAIRLELAASSSLLGTAVAAVGSVLGIEPDDRYDRLARCYAKTRPLRVVAY